VAADDIQLSVPDSELPGIKMLVHMSDENLEALENALSSRRPTLDAEALAKSVAEATGLDFAAVQTVTSVLRRWAFIERRVGLSPSGLLAALASSLEENREWHTEDAQALSDRTESLAKLLAPTGPLGVIAKATELLVEQQFLFCKARIITDARPVFDEQAEGMLGLIPSHCLALTYHEGPETRELHLLMDAKDMRQLHDQLERAQRKEKLMSRMLTEAGLTVIETESTPDA